MNLDGYKRINAVLDEAHVGVDPTVCPIPTDLDNFRYISIQERFEVSPVNILNALHDAGLMKRDGPFTIIQSPSLVYLGTSGNTHTFVDTSEK